jgi:hypothetical protein
MVKNLTPTPLLSKERGEFLIKRGGSLATSQRRGELTLDIEFFL